MRLPVPSRVECVLGLDRVVPYSYRLGVNDITAHCISLLFSWLPEGMMEGRQIPKKTAFTQPARFMNINEVRVLHIKLMGWCCSLYATRVLKDIQTENEEQKIGVQTVENALKAPTLTIASNVGAEGALIIGKLLEQDDLNFGYDAAKGQYVNMVEAGIIDPVKVIKTAARQLLLIFEARKIHLKTE
ncbi:hypothetical protein CASFOL_017931 [Castilleja foliolosa]|uniref:Spt5 KOW domain-containing protein n=1 Tax=Castilleja foliolosa TaxID=1961234 RepID=A0ABD3DCF3_9LAMI